MSLMHSEYAAASITGCGCWRRISTAPGPEIAGGLYHHGTPVPEEAARGPFRPVPEGTPWGHTWEYMWVRGEAVLPEEARDQAVVLSLDMGGEATCSSMGSPSAPAGRNG